MNDFDKDTHIDHILHNTGTINDKSAIRMLAQTAANAINVNEQEILTRLRRPKTVQSAAIGGGVAIPNIQMNNIDAPLTVLMHLKTPVAFEPTPDDEPVDIACLLISPKSDGPIHLRRLSRLARMLTDPDMQRKIRESDNAEALHLAVNNNGGWLVAA